MCGGSVLVIFLPGSSRGERYSRKSRFHSGDEILPLSRPVPSLPLRFCLFGTRKIFIISALALQQRYQGIFSSWHAEGLRSISNRVPWGNAQQREMPPKRIRSIDWTALQPRWRHLGSLWHVRLPPGQKTQVHTFRRGHKIRGWCVHACTNARNLDNTRHAGSTEVRGCLRVAWPSTLARVRAFCSLLCHSLKLEILAV